MDFSDGLNCVIGGRGTGKTTVLEALRYILDRMPNETVDHKRYEALEKLLQANLGTGSVKVELETADGVLYSVARAFGETPLVTNADGKPVDIRIGHDMHFGVDIYSQNQIEDIANNDYFQLQLIDKFIQKPLDELERQIRDATNLLETNGQKILDRKKVIGDQTEATRELPDITEKIHNFEKAEGGAQSEEMRKGHEGKSLRDRESKLVESLRTSYQESSGTLTAAALDVKRRFADAIGQDFSASSNKDVIAKVKQDAQLALEKMQSHIDAAIDVLRDAEAGLNPSQSALAELHALQEQAYRALLDKDEKERAKGLERTRLEQRYSDLKAKEKILTDTKADLEALYRDRNSFRGQLSDLRDQRYRLRVEVANRLNEHGRGITFADRFPLCVSYPSPEFMPVVTFTYIDSEHKNLEAFITHLRTYRPLFRQLPSFQFLYVSTASGEQKEAAELFALFTDGKNLEDLTRYFDLQTKWDNEQYGLLSEAEVIFMSEGRKRFTGDSIDRLYYLWKRNQLPKDLQIDAASTLLATQKILFRAVTVPGHEGIFGNSARRWSDGWQIRGTSGESSPRKSPAPPIQSLQRTADT